MIISVYHKIDINVCQMLLLGGGVYLTIHYITSIDLWKELPIEKVTQHSLIQIKHLFTFIRYNMIINCQVHNYGIILMTCGKHKTIQS